MPVPRMRPIIDPDGDMKGPHFTIVDDDAHTLYFLEHALSRAFPQSEIVKFSDGAEALEYLQHSPTDLLVTDHSMDRLNGADLIRALRSGGSTLPIIMVSNSPDAEEQGTAAGAN